MNAAQRAGDPIDAMGTCAFLPSVEEVDRIYAPHVV
jgi:hypothetical protein